MSIKKCRKFKILSGFALLHSRYGCLAVLPTPLHRRQAVAFAPPTLAQVDPLQKHSQFPSGDLFSPRLRERKLKRACLQPLVTQFRMQMLRSQPRALCASRIRSIRSAGGSYLVSRPQLSPHQRPYPGPQTHRPELGYFFVATPLSRRDLTGPPLSLLLRAYRSRRMTRASIRFPRR